MTPSNVTLRVFSLQGNLQRRVLNEGQRIHKRRRLRVHHALDDAWANRIVLRRKQKMPAGAGALHEASPPLKELTMQIEETELSRTEVLRRLKSLLIEKSGQVPGVHHTDGFNCGLLQINEAIPKVHCMQLGWGAPPEIDVWVRSRYGRARRPTDKHLHMTLAHFEKLSAPHAS